MIPDAEEGLSYKVPAFRLEGRVVAGFAAFKHHLSYLPFRGSVLDRMGSDLDGYERARSSLHFAVDKPLPKALVKKLVELRMA